MFAQPSFFVSYFFRGCGDNAGKTQQAGVFLDSPVSGLEYVRDALSGATDTDGSFFYSDGSAVEFFVGDIFLHVAAGVKIMTPVSLWVWEAKEQV